MAKNSREQIEKDEIKILEELKINAHGSINEIAKRCGFSRQKVWRIIKKLEEEHIIWGYTAIVNEEKKGLEDYIALIKRTVKPIDKELIDTIVSRKLEELASKGNIFIDSSMYVHGEYDWIICFQTSGIKKAKIFCEMLNSTYHTYITQIKLLQVMFPIKIKGIENPDAEELEQFMI